MARKKTTEPLHIDWLKAVILERMQHKGLSKADLAFVAGIGINRFYELMSQPVPAWPYDERRRVLEAVKVKVADLPRDVQMEIAQY